VFTAARNTKRREITGSGATNTPITTKSEDSFFAAIGVVFVTALLYLGIRRLRARGAIDRIVLWIPRPDWPRRNRCRKAAARVKERNAVSNERQDKQEAGLSTPKCVSSLQQD
jgi:hypothetical protein